MSQYDIAEMIFEAEEGKRVSELMRATGNVESTVRTTLYKLEDKGLVIEEGGVYRQHPDASEDDLERVRSFTIDELKNRD